MTETASRPGASGAGGAGGASTFTSSASLYVGDLQPDVTEALLFEFFNAVGPVASIRVCRDAVTRRSLGYGYVNFHNIADAERALDTMNFAVIRGKSCRIMYSMRDPSLRKSGVGNIFVKNLDKSIDHKTLYDTFSMFGNILSCKVAINDKGESLGYGFVHYASPDAAQKAIDKVNEMKIANRTVYVAQFIPRSKRDSTKNKEGTFTNVYVKNLPKDWTVDDLVDAFKKFGEIQTWKPRKLDDEGNKIEGDKEEMYVKICQGPQLGKSKIETQYGFVNYKMKEDAAKAVEEMNNTVPPGAEDGNALYVGRAQRKRERQARLKDQQAKRKQERQKRYQGVNLYVKNLHDQIVDEKLAELFEQFGAITSARVMRDEEDRSKGFGFVCFRTPDQATKAVTEMNSKIVEGKPLYVALAQRKEVRRQMLEQQFRQQEQGRFSQGQQQGGYNMQRAGGFTGAGRGFGQGGFPMQGRAFPGQFGMANAFGAMNNMRSPMVRAGAQGQFGMNPMARRAQQGPRPGQTRGGPPQNQRAANPMQGRPRQQNGIPSPQVQTPQSYAVNAALAATTPTALGGGSQIDPQQLAATDDATAKQMIGERIFPLIQEREPKLAGKITGMLLEMDNTELLNLLEDSQALESKIQEAMAVLRAHTQQQSHMSSVPSES